MESLKERNKSKTREQLTEMFVQSLNEQKLPWYAVWNSMPQQNAVSAKPYRGINAFWLAMYSAAAGYNDPRWCTFNQAKDKGWHIKPGSKGVPVEFWSALHRPTHKVVDFREAARMIREGEAERGDFQYYTKNSYVFNAAQIEGIPALKMENRSVDISLIRQNRDTLIKNMAVGFDGNGRDCHYTPSLDTIVMPPEGAFRDTYGYMCSFLHEAGHATAAPSRLDRGFGTTKEEYAIEELRAEIASAMVAQQLGIPLTDEQMQSNLDLHKAYIQGWAEAIKDAPKCLFDAIKDAEQISDYLIEKGEFQQAIEAQQTMSENPEQFILTNGKLASVPLSILPEKEKGLPETQPEVSFSCIDRHYYAEVATATGRVRCPIQFRPGRWLYETADRQIHQLTPEEAGRLMDFIARDVQAEAVRQQDEIRRNAEAAPKKEHSKVL